MSEGRASYQTVALPRRRPAHVAALHWQQASAADRLARERQLLALVHATIREAELSKVVVELLRLHGWLYSHTPDSRRAEAGEPDIRAVHQRRELPILFLELKTTRGRVRPGQRLWHEAMEGRSGVLALVIRPWDLPWLNEILKGVRVCG